MIGQSQNESSVVVSGRGACGRGQRSRLSVLGSSQLSGAGLRDQRDGNVLTVTQAASSSSKPHLFHEFVSLFPGLRSASTAVAPTSLPRPPSCLEMPTSNFSPNQRPCPPSSLRPPRRPRPDAPTPWSTSAGGSPPAGNAAQSRCSPPTAWRTTPRRPSLGR